MVQGSKTDYGGNWYTRVQGAKGLRCAGTQSGFLVLLTVTGFASLYRTCSDYCQIHIILADIFNSAEVDCVFENRQIQQRLKLRSIRFVCGRNQEIAFKTPICLFKHLKIL